MAALTPLRPVLSPSADSERVQKSVGKWRRRSSLIFLFRRALPVIMLAMIGLVTWDAIRRNARQEVTERPKSVPIRMINPVFRGRDDGRSYVLSAREAVRDNRDQLKIALVEPRMVMQNQPGEPPTRVSAQRGVYREDTQILYLEGDVRYSDANGWLFRTKNATVNNKTNVITGEDGVEGEGPNGRVKAEGYRIYNQGQRVVFRGNVQTVFNDK